MLAPMLIFSGYVVPYANIPIYFKWAYYASFFQCARHKGLERWSVALPLRVRRARAPVEPDAFAILMVNEFSERSFTEACPAELALNALDEGIMDELHRLLPNRTLNFTLPLHHHNFTCTGHAYLENIGMWPVRYGGLQYHFAILGSYLAAAFVCTYVVLRIKLRE